MFLLQHVLNNLVSLIGTPATDQVYKNECLCQSHQNYYIPNNLKNLLQNMYFYSVNTTKMHNIKEMSTWNTNVKINWMFFKENNFIGLFLVKIAYCRSVLYPCAISNFDINFECSNPLNATFVSVTKVRHHGFMWPSCRINVIYYTKI